MEQNTDEWRKWRHDKIGGSDASIIMGVSKYMNRADLLLHKATPFDQAVDSKKSPVADMGHVVEEMERSRFEFLHNQKFMSALMTHPEIPWLSTSFDGLSMDETIAWECKLVGNDTFLEVEKNIVPEKFYPQLQHQFLVNQKLKKTYLYCILYSKSMFVKMDQSTFVRSFMEVERDNEYIQNKLMPELQRFRSDLLSNKDFSFLDATAKELYEIKSQIDVLNTKKEQLESKLKEELFTVGKVSTKNFRYSYVAQKPKTSYDVDEICKQHLINKEAYKKVGKVFYKLDVKKQSAD